MGLVNEEGVDPSPLSEIAFEVHSGIENVVVVADDAVAVLGDIQGKFERTHLVPSCHVFDDRACQGIVLKQVFERVVEPIVIADGELTGLLVTRLPIARVETDSVAGSQGEALDFESAGAQIVEGFFGGDAPARLRRQEEHLLDSVLPQRPCRWK